MVCKCKKCGKILFKVIEHKPEISCGVAIGHIEVEAVCPVCNDVNRIKISI